MSYKIGSFNVQNLSDNPNVKRDQKFKDIAKIIHYEKFDIVALQEVLSEEAVKQLVQGLGTYRWEYRFKQPQTYGGKQEGYAYIWNANRVKLIEEPTIYNRYTSRYEFGQQGLVRPPMVARFTPNTVNGGPFVEFRLINTHITFNKSIHYAEDIGNSELRHKEFDILTQDIYRLVSTKGYGDNMPAYTFLMGDYNLCLSSNGPKIEDTVTVYQQKNRKLLTVQDKKTTVKQNIDSKDEDYYSKDYDHFTFDKCYVEKMDLRYDRVDVPKRMYSDKVEKYRVYVSDHVPIKLLIDLNTRGSRVVCNIQKNS